VRFHVAMNELRLMYRGQCFAHFLTDIRRFACAQAALRDARRQRLTIDEVHPEADPPVVAIGAVHGHDIGVANSREFSRLMKNE
jgi:hypothetical protein